MTKNIKALAKINPNDVPNNTILKNSVNTVCVKPPSPPTLINSKTKTATKAPIGSIKIPSHFNTAATSFFNGIFLKIGDITVGPVTMINDANKSDKFQPKSKGNVQKLHPRKR